MIRIAPPYLRTVLPGLIAYVPLRFVKVDDPKRETRGDERNDHKHGEAA